MLHGPFWALVRKNFKLRQRSKRGMRCDLLLPVFTWAMSVALFYMIAGVVSSDSDPGQYEWRPVVPTASTCAFYQWDDDAGSTGDCLELLYTPNDHDGVNELMRNLEISDMKTKGFETESEMVAEAGTNFDFWAGVVFTLTDEQIETGDLLAEGVDAINVTLRMPSANLPTSVLVWSSWDEPSTPAEYFDTGFLAIQTALFDAMLTYGAINDVTVQSAIQRFPYLGSETASDESTESGYDFTLYHVFKALLGVFFALHTSLWFFKFATDMVEEKTVRARAMMSMMGLGDAAYFASWFTTSMIACVPVTFLIIALSYMTGWLSGSSFFLMWLAYLLSVMGQTAFCFLIATVVEKPRYAGPLVAVIFLGCAAAAMVIASNSNEGSDGLKEWMSVLPSVGLVVVVYEAIALQTHDSGLTFDTWHDTTPKVSNILLIMFLDVFLYLLAAWYMDNVVAGEFGAARSPLFFLEREYWFPSRPDAGAGAGAGKDQLSVSLLSDSGSSSDGAGQEEDSVEPPADPSLEAAIDIRHLRKVYSNGTVAVEDLSVKFYRGQISVLLGHNGAGKSTTISMITGLYPPTAGDALMDGRSIATDMDAVKRRMGVCPQHDVLWDKLTVREHLQLYSELKRVPASQARHEIDELMDDLGILAKADYPAGSLSGGQKRKLSVGIALIGRSPIVVLDEPTSGVDVVARREIWRCLTKHKAGRSILLITHFLDEADVLGDRVAILSAGKLRCCGSSLYLKNRFGTGYSLTLAKTAEADEAAISALVRSHVGTASVVSSVAGELVFRLPLDAVPAFAGLFAALDDPAAAALGIASHGLGSSTLEDVFLRLAHDAKDTPNRELGQTAAERKTERRRTFATDESFREEERLGAMLQQDIISTPSQGISALAQFRALYMKRLLLAWRHKRHTLFNMAVPIGLFFCGLLLWQAQLHTYAASQGSTQLKYHSYAAEYGFQDALYYEDANDDAASLLQGWGANPVHVDSAFDAAGSSYANVIETLGVDLNLAEADPPTFYNMTNYYNDTVGPVLPNALASLQNSAASDHMHVGWNLFSHPMPTSSFMLALSNINSIAYTGLIWAVALGFWAGGCAAYVVREEESGLRYLQNVNGVSKLTYWVANMAWDCTVWFVTSSMIMIAMSSFNYRWVGHTGDGLFGVWLLLLLCAPGSLLCAYYIGRGQGDGNTVQGSQAFIAFCHMFAMVSATASPSFSSGPASIGVRVTCYAFALMYPAGAGVFGILIIGDLCGMRSTVGVAADASVLEFEVTGYIFLCLFASTFGWGLAHLQTDIGIASLCSCLVPRRVVQPKQFHDPEAQAGAGDSDVLAEEARIAQGRNLPGYDEDVVQLRRVRKVYPPKFGDGADKVAVKCLSLGIPAGECFGLLGHNGAGKTSTLSILSGNSSASFGEAFIAGYHVEVDADLARRNIGLCPQFDLLFDRLNAYEHLEMYGRLKGIPSHKVKPLAKAFVELTDLGAFASKWAGGYSGGNKRKLSLAIALIGNPKAVLLDEPSTGMDPQARRFMWNVITKLAQVKGSDGQGRAIALTSHSMEEIEALCTRIGVMVQGEMACLGTGTHLKNKFGDGYRLELKGKTPEHGELIERFVELQWPAAMLLEAHGPKRVFEMSSEAASLADIFGVIETHRAELMIDDYGCSQTTLEQVFIKVAATDHDGELETMQQGNRLHWMDILYSLGWLLMSAILPGIHQLRWGNTGRALLFFLTYNGIGIGLLWDLVFIDLKTLQAVREYGHLRCCQFASFGSRGWDDVAAPPSAVRDNELHGGSEQKPDSSYQQL